jgi:uncharacterized protein (TIRG00374 family)
MVKKKLPGHIMNSTNKLSKNIIWIIVSFLLAILTISTVLKVSKDISLDDLFEAVESANKLYLGLGIIASALYVWFEGVAICSILNKIGYRRKLSQGFIYSTADIYFSAITPSATGGQPASAFFMIRDGLSVGITTATLILNLMMYTFSIIILGAISFIISPGVFTGFGQVSRIFIVVGAVTLTLLALAFLILLKNEELIFGPISKLFSFLHRKKLIKDKTDIEERLAVTKEEYKMCSEIVSKGKLMFLPAFIWNILQRGFQIAVPMLIYASLGGDKTKMASVFSKQCLITIGYNFVPIPGGMGISDYLMVDGFNEMMGESLAFTAELLSRGITFYICVSLSGIITLIGYFLKKKAKKLPYA